MGIVLVVDDSSFTRNIHESLLTRAGYDVKQADNIEAARRLLSSETFVAVVTDLLMPGGNGMDLVREVRAHHPGLTVIVCSADKQRARRDMAAGLGAAFVAKPLTADRLAEVLGPRDCGD